MSIESLIDSKVYSWLSSFTGETAIKADQNAPSPAFPFIQWKVQSIDTIGHDFESNVKENGNIDIGGERMLTLRIFRFGNDSYNVLNKLLFSLNFATVRKILREAGLSFLDVLVLTNTTNLYSSLMEQSAMMDLRMALATQYEMLESEGGGIIESVEIDYVYKDAGDTTINQGSFIVDENF